MKIIKNQTGLTLIELLVAVTIFSFISVIIYNVLLDGMKYYSKAEETVFIQQEANYILNLLKEQHQNAEHDYTVSIENNHNTIIINKNRSNELDVSNPKYLYQICDLNNATLSCDMGESDDSTITITPSTENFHVKVILTNKEHPDITYEITTILSRL